MFPTMTTNGSYQASAYLPGHKDVAHHELRTAESECDYLLSTLRQMVDANPSLRLLDVGAGSGTITASLAKYLPKGQVTAVDLSSEILAKAAAHAEREEAKNIVFQEANVNDLPFPNNTFDVVHTSQMLLYQPSPPSALRELLRVTKPGGIVALRESDMRTWSFWPITPALEKFYQIELATHEANGGTNPAGPQLISWALQAGAKRENITPSQGTWCYAQPFERGVWGQSWAKRTRSGEIGKKALEMGLATQEELEEMARAWEEWSVAEDAWFGCLHGQVLIRK